MQTSYQARRMFAGLQGNLSVMQRTARLEQAVAVMDWRLSQDYDDIQWSVLMTDYAVGNGQQFGYFV